VGVGAGSPVSALSFIPGGNEVRALKKRVFETLRGQGAQVRAKSKRNQDIRVRNLCDKNYLKPREDKKAGIGRQQKDNTKEGGKERR